MQKAIVVGSLAILLSAVVASVIWFHARMPPNCTDPRTIALVRRSLTAHYHLPPNTTLDHIHTIAGGFVALQFVCAATPGGFDPHELPQGMPIPGEVHYTSRLTPDRSRHQVTVELQPLLSWEPVQ